MIKHVLGGVFFSLVNESVFMIVLQRRVSKCENKLYLLDEVICDWSEFFLTLLLRIRWLGDQLMIFVPLFDFNNQFFQSIVSNFPITSVGRLVDATNDRWISCLDLNFLLFLEWEIHFSMHFSGRISDPINHIIVTRRQSTWKPSRSLFLDTCSASRARLLKYKNFVPTSLFANQTTGKTKKEMKLWKKYGYSKRRRRDGRLSFSAPRGLCRMQRLRRCVYFHSVEYYECGVAPHRIGPSGNEVDRI